MVSFYSDNPFLAQSSSQSCSLGDPERTTSSSPRHPASREIEDNAGRMPVPTVEILQVPIEAAKVRRISPPLKLALGYHEL